jgi:hypothetical protein
LNDNDGIGYFFEGSECPAGMDDNRLHMDGIILLETRRNWESHCTQVCPAPSSLMFVGTRSNLFPGAGFLCLEGSRCYTPCSIAPSRGEFGLIVPWSKHLKADVGALLHLPPQVAIGSGGC